MPGSGTRTPRPVETSETGSAARRAAILVGFPETLEAALSGLLLSHHFSVQQVQSVNDAIELVCVGHVDLVLASSRCSTAAVVKLTEALGQPRQTRVIVLLGGRDPDAERRYRAAGLAHVMTMPVHADDLLRVAFPRPT